MIKQYFINILIPCLGHGTRNAAYETWYSNKSKDLDNSSPEISIYYFWSASR